MSSVGVYGYLTGKKRTSEDNERVLPSLSRLHAAICMRAHTLQYADSMMLVVLQCDKTGP